jgi:hypothetical protein
MDLRLPECQGTLLIRSDYGTPTVWAEFQSRIKEPNDDGFLACVSVVDEAGWQGVAAGTLLELVPGEHEHHAFVLVADAVTLGSGEFPVLVLGLSGATRGQSFRVVAAALWSVENNLSIANMDFEEFAESVDEDGVFRGF